MDRKLRFETTYRRLGGLYKPGMWNRVERELPDAWRNLRKKEEEIEKKWSTTSDTEFKALCGNLSKLIAISLVKVRKVMGDCDYEENRRGNTRRKID